MNNNQAGSHCESSMNALPATDSCRADRALILQFPVYGRIDQRQCTPLFLFIRQKKLESMRNQNNQ
jgi:hypothetical protein